MTHDVVLYNMTTRPIGTTMSNPVFLTCINTTHFPKFPDVPMAFNLLSGEIESTLTIGIDIALVVANSKDTTHFYLKKNKKGWKREKKKKNKKPI